MSDHQELIVELPVVEKMKTDDRLKYAKKRRAQQLKRFQQFEKKEKKSTKKVKRATRRIRFNAGLMLLEAAARNDIVEVTELLQEGVNPDVSNEDGLTALHQCCIDDYKEMVELLLEKKAKVNSTDVELWTPLHASATCGHHDLSKILVEAGADLLAVNADGNMPYDICDDDRTLGYIEGEMAKNGVTQEDIDEKRQCHEKAMLTDLERIVKEAKAASSNHLSPPSSTSPLLGGGGPSPSSSTTNHVKEKLEFVDNHGATPLHIAAANGYIQVARFLIDHGVSMDMRDNDSWQPIHASACWGQPMLLEFLALHGADLDAQTTFGETPYDLCEDPEFRQLILEIKERVRAHRTHHQRTSSERLRPRGSRMTQSGRSSTSVRRTSFKNKTRLSWMEANYEKSHLAETIAISPPGPGAVGAMTTKSTSTAGATSTASKSESTVPTNTSVAPLESAPTIHSSTTAAPVVLTIDKEEDDVANIMFPPATEIDQISLDDSDTAAVGSAASPPPSSSGPPDEAGSVREKFHLQLNGDDVDLHSGDAILNGFESERTNIDDIDLSDHSSPPEEVKRSVRGATNHQSYLDVNEDDDLRRSNLKPESIIQYPVGDSLRSAHRSSAVSAASSATTTPFDVGLSVYGEHTTTTSPPKQHSRDLGSSPLENKSAPRDTDTDTTSFSHDTILPPQSRDTSSPPRDPVSPPISSKASDNSFTAPVSSSTTAAKTKEPKPNKVQNSFNIPNQISPSNRSISKSTHSSGQIPQNNGAYESYNETVVQLKTFTADRNNVDHSRIHSKVFTIDKDSLQSDIDGSTADDSFMNHAEDRPQPIGSEDEEIHKSDSNIDRHNMVLSTGGGPTVPAATTVIAKPQLNSQSEHRRSHPPSDQPIRASDVILNQDFRSQNQESHDSKNDKPHDFSSTPHGQMHNNQVVSSSDSARPPPQHHVTKSDSFSPAVADSYVSQTLPKKSNIKRDNPDRRQELQQVNGVSRGEPLRSADYSSLPRHGVTQSHSHPRLPGITGSGGIGGGGGANRTDSSASVFRSGTLADLKAARRNRLLTNQHFVDDIAMLNQHVAPGGNDTSASGTTGGNYYSLGRNRSKSGTRTASAVSPHAPGVSDGSSHNISGGGGHQGHLEGTYEPVVSAGSARYKTEDLAYILGTDPKRRHSLAGTSGDKCCIVM